MRLVNMHPNSTYFTRLSLSTSLFLPSEQCACLLDLGVFCVCIDSGVSFKPALPDLWGVRAEQHCDGTRGAFGAHPPHKSTTFIYLSVIANGADARAFCACIYFGACVSRATSMLRPGARLPRPRRRCACDYGDVRHKTEQAEAEEVYTRWINTFGIEVFLAIF